MSLPSLRSLPSLSLAPLLESPLSLAYAAGLALLIVYSSAVPDDLRRFADTLLGRILGVLWIYVVVEGMGWMFGLFSAMAFLAVLYLSPHSLWMGVGAEEREGFDGSPKAAKEGFLSAFGGQLPQGSRREHEGFDGSSGVVEKERIGKRWFVERVLGEHPVAISTEKVTTLPVQD